MATQDIKELERKVNAAFARWRKSNSPKDANGYVQACRKYVEACNAQKQQQQQQQSSAK